MLPLKRFVVPHGDHPGTFGYRRTHDIHTGIDLYTNEGAEVYAIESGVVVKIDIFTGPKVGTPWWNETWAMMVEIHGGGVINYGEINSLFDIHVGDDISAGQLLGTVVPVLHPKDHRPDIPGHSCSMLHLEWYRRGIREFAEWKLDQLCPNGLYDPTPLVQ